jgi:hypothetical protein
MQGRRGISWWGDSSRLETDYWPVRDKRDAWMGGRVYAVMVLRWELLFFNLWEHIRKLLSSGGTVTGARHTHPVNPRTLPTVRANPDRTTAESYILENEMKLVPIARNVPQDTYYLKRYIKRTESQNIPHLVLCCFVAQRSGNYIHTGGGVDSMAHTCMAIPSWAQLRGSIHTNSEHLPAPSTKNEQTIISPAIGDFS